MQLHSIAPEWRAHIASLIDINCQRRSLEAMRSSMNISLPEGMKAWVEEQVVNRGYATPSEYIRELLREDQKRKVRDEIDQKLLNALDSGEPRDFTDSDWERIRRRVLAHKKTRRR
jgi:antitoxin ParD1/3/4